MKRRIAGHLRNDQNESWALLDCGHRGPRAAVATEQVECTRCDHFEWPADFRAYKQTPEFTADTVPAGLRRDHSTKSGVWARIVVAEGELEYHVDALGAHFVLTPTCHGIVVPEVLHHVTPRGEVRFHVEFHRREAPPGERTE